MMLAARGRAETLMRSNLKTTSNARRRMVVETVMKSEERTAAVGTSSGDIE